MKPPEFPNDFVKNHCSQVLEARHWRKVMNSGDDPEDDLDYAECAFGSAGFGLKCESCQLFLMHPPIKESEKFIPAIKEYYRQVELYEKYLTEQAKADKLLEHMSGAGI